MIDLHCHYLPGVDDGAENLEEALELVAAAAANGIRHAVLTPHVHPGRYENTLSSLQPLFDELVVAVDRAGLEIELSLAGEVRLLPESLALLAANELPMLGYWGGTPIVLLEFPHDRIPFGAHEAIEFLQTQGVLPMIAHPERNKDVMRDWRRIQPFVEQGCLLQLTAASVCGYFGPAPQISAERLLSQGWVSVIATDAHNMRSRPPVLAEGRAAIEHRYGATAAALLTEVNPARIIGRVEDQSQQQLATGAAASVQPNALRS